MVVKIYKGIETKSFSTLRERAFNIIFEEFTRFCIASGTTTNEIFKYNLEYLQRVYSSEILSKLLKNSDLTTQHLDFLLNKHLKKLNIANISHVLSKNEIIEKVSKIGHSLARLYTSSSKRGGLGIFKALVPCSPNLTRICIPSICDDQLLTLIAATCFQLSELNVSYSKAVTVVGLSALCRNTCPLKILYINGTSVSINDIAILLKNLPSLEELHHEQFMDVLYSIHKEDVDNNCLEKISKYNLIDFNFTLLRSSKLIYLLSICSKLCPMMKKIAICVEKYEELHLCFSFSELEDVLIHFNREISLYKLDDFLSIRGEKLKHLELHSCYLSMSTVIFCCPNLETLFLDSIDYKNLEKNPPKTLEKFYLLKLKELRLSSIDFEVDLEVESIVQLLSSSPHLEKLWLLASRGTHSNAVEKISSFPLSCSIKELNFLDSDVKIGDLQQLVLSRSALERLYIKQCHNIKLEEFNMVTQTIAARKGSVDVFYGFISTDFTPDELIDLSDLEYFA